jgi:two-component system, OmpR family, response regulator ChvI
MLYHFRPDIFHMSLESGGSSNNNNHRLLVVDDEKDIAVVLKSGLEGHGFEVDAFTDPLKAEEMFKPNWYDLAIIDIRMPRVNGFDLYKMLKKKDESLKICFLTAFDIYVDEFRRVFPSLTVNCFAKKPITIAELAKLVESELKASK